jgi:branched-chain amino acid transport system ATP-binding protein
MTGAAVLEAEILVLGYGDSEVVKGVSLRAQAGSITAIVGPNGSGKTTLLKGLAGLLPAKRGVLRFAGQDVTGVDTADLVRRGLGYVPQMKNVFPTMTVRENLEIGAATCRKQLRERTANVTQLFPDLAVSQAKPAGQLSGGQRNMLALARALMTAPSILLVDEPTAGLSPKFSSAVWGHLRAVVASGVGVVIVEQNTRAALELAENALLLVNGEVLFSGRASVLAADRELAHAYLGGQSRSGPTSI